MQEFDPNYRDLQKIVKPGSNRGLYTNYATKCACPAIVGSPIRLGLKIFSKVLLEQWDDDCNLRSKSNSFWRLDSGNETKPDRIWNDQPIHTMHDPSSHFFHEIGKPVNKQSIAITVALSPIMVVSWIQRRSSTYKNAAWGRKHNRWNNLWYTPPRRDQKWADTAAPNGQFL